MSAQDVARLSAQRQAAVSIHGKQAGTIMHIHMAIGCGILQLLENAFSTWHLASAIHVLYGGHACDKSLTLLSCVLLP